MGTKGTKRFLAGEQRRRVRAHPAPCQERELSAKAFQDTGAGENIPSCSAASQRHSQVSLEHCELRSLTAARSRAPDSEPAIASRSEPPPALCSWAVPRDTSSSALSQISSLSLLPASGSLSELGIRHRPLLLNTEIRTGAGEELTRTELRLPRAHPFSRRAEITGSDTWRFELVRERVDYCPAAAEP